MPTLAWVEQQGTAERIVFAGLWLEVAQDRTRERITEPGCVGEDVPNGGRPGRRAEPIDAARRVERFETTPESRGGGEIVKTKLLQPGGRTVNINYLVRGERVVDIYLNGTISDLAMRRDEFASVIAAGGADALIKRLRDRTENLLGK
ncbi:MAG: hypothetical protein E6G75_19685 [Alphaproteobacteria bacterium]|nr:MAG: hypothetical protein E6G75_19685 [Alphaproteobacteria bacterium]